MPRHVGFVPARLGSKGVPKKNRMFFDDCTTFLNSLSWIDQVFVSSDDAILLEEATKKGYTAMRRPSELAADDVSIKRVVQHDLHAMNLDPDSFVWLFYLPLVYRKREDFDWARNIIESSNAKSWCTFIPVSTHPFNCWQYFEPEGRLEQFVENSCYRRQDLPKAWMLHHYICCFKPEVISKLNEELVYQYTYPIFLSEAKSSLLMEVDTPEDLIKWKKRLKEN